MVIKLKIPALPIDYRAVLVSLLKACLQNYDTALYERWYGKNSTESKSFTFAVNLPEAKFAVDTIALGKDEIIWNLSTADYCDGIDLYNALLAGRGKPYPLKDGNEMTIGKCRIQNQPAITDNTVAIKFLSPLAVRSHGSDNTDRYYTYDDAEFEPMLKTVLENQFKSCPAEGSEIRLTPFAAKKTVVKVFGLKIPVSLGVYRLSGSAEALSYLHRTGMGSRRNLGFGMFEIL